MRVLVLGGGVIGVTTAYRLAREGHEVTLLERNAGVAEETSFANAGLVAPGHAYAWSSPEAPLILLKSLILRDQSLRFRLSSDPALWSWSWLFLRQCNLEAARRNTKRKHALCRYSQAALQELTAEEPLDYDMKRGGLLYLYRSEISFERAAARTAILREGGQELEVADRDRAAEIDPALAPVKERIAGAVYCPSDESGDARKFTRQLADKAAALGVAFRHGVTIERILPDGDRISCVATDQGRFDAEAYVLALGCGAAALARPLGVRLPIYPVKGYSVTLPLAGRNNPPTMGGVDEDRLVAYAPLGGRLRLTATAEFAGYDRRHRPSDFKGMLAAARELFPEAADWERPDYWACLRPMTPEGTPRFGRARHGNLYYNVGHGHMGWTMACGAARITADLIAGRKPEIDLAGLTVTGEAA